MYGRLVWSLLLLFLLLLILLLLFIDLYSVLALAGKLIRYVVPHINVRVPLNAKLLFCGF